jgi:hypothetical protein
MPLIVIPVRSCTSLDFLVLSLNSHIVSISVHYCFTHVFSVAYCSFSFFLFFLQNHMENEVKDDYLVLTCEKQNVESWTHGLQNISCNELEI